jgi:hypothetical protein
VITSPSVSFICCVESGPLEVQTLRLIESLRLWGGVHARAPVIAVTPRPGPGLARETLKAFDRLEVRYLRRAPVSSYDWFNFYNKPLAVAIGEEAATTEAVAWLDSDMLVVGDPTELRLRSDEDFLACASDKEMGSSGPDDPYDPLWRANCRVLGIDLESLPWLVTEQEKARIRLYWNGGLFVYRRSTRFGARYLQTCTAMMDARNRTSAPGFSIGFNEMSAIGLSMHLMGLKWRALPHSHNYSMGSKSHAQWYREEQLRAARIVHYHDSMWPWFWDTFVECLHAAHPEVAGWLSPQGPMHNSASIFNRLWGKALRSSRDRKQREYVETCRSV